MEQVLRDIGITQRGEYSSDDNYVIDLEDSNVFNKVFSKLDKSDLVEENEDSSVTNIHITNIMYVGEGYSFNLIADFDQDTYKLVVTEMEGE